MKKIGRSGIEYAVNPDGSKGFAWNFYPGCQHGIDVCPVSPHCWAKAMWKRQMGAAAKRGITLPDFHHPHLIPELLLAPLSVKKPSTILVNFMGDLFGDWVDPFTLVSVTLPNGQELKDCSMYLVVKDIIQHCPEHTFLFLTKNPKGLIPWSYFPNNAWVGVSVCNQRMFNAAVAYLARTKAKHKWLSFEPLLEEIIINGGYDLSGHDDFKEAGIDWVVVGAQSQPVKYPDIEWIRAIVHTADQAGIPIWLKSNLEGAIPQDRPFCKPIPLSGWDDNFSWEIRQELPKWI